MGSVVGLEDLWNDRWSPLDHFDVSFALRRSCPDHIALLGDVPGGLEEVEGLSVYHELAVTASNVDFGGAVGSKRSDCC